MQSPATRASSGARRAIPRHPPHHSERPDGPAAGAGCGISPCMAATTKETVELLGRVPLFAELEVDELARVAEVAVPRAFSAGHCVFREGDQSDTCYIVRTGHARAIREHRDGRVITLKQLRPGRHLRRAGDVRRRAPLGDRSRRSTSSRSIAILGADMRRLLRLHADLSVKLIIATGPAPARDQRAPRAPVLPDRAEPCRHRARAARRRRRGGGRRRARTCSSPPPRRSWRSSPAPRASRRAASSPTLERAGVISQGRGRLTVHDPAALERYVY